MPGLFDMAVSGISQLLGSAPPKAGLLSGLTNEDIAQAMEWQKSVMRNVPNQVPYTPKQIEADRLARWASAGGNSPEDVRQGGLLSMGLTPQRYDNAMMWGGLAPIAATVFHGSPHRFDKFDMSKIGTGEGAQAYGHGLYFAENPKVANAYGKNLGRDDATQIFWKGRNVTESGPLGELPSDDLAALFVGRYKHNAIEALRERSSMVSGGEKLKIAEAIKSIETGRINPKEVTERVGNLYKVDLPDEAVAKMLDWDKPLSQQPESVRKALKGAWKPTSMMRAIGYEPTAGDLLQEVAKKNGWDRNGSEMTAFLKSSGIPGIRYLDAGSRTGGKGTRNYVVFDDQIPKIIGRE